EAAAAAERGAEVGEVAGTVPPERFLDEWARPVVERAETMLETIAEAVGQHDVATMGEAELESFFEQFEPRGTGLEQHFEDFLKGLWRKVKKAVGGVVGLAKKGIAFALKAIPGLGAILRKLKALVRPLLKRVLGMAIDRLPAGV